MSFKDDPKKTDWWKAIAEVPIKTLAAEHVACKGFNPAVMRELAEQALDPDFASLPEGYDARLRWFTGWFSRFTEICKRLRT